LIKSLPLRVPVLCDALDGLTVTVEEREYEVAVKYATEHRCGVRIRGPNLSANVSGTDPLKDGSPLLKPTSIENSAEITCRVVEAVHQKMHAILSKHPVNLKRQTLGKPMANVVLFRGCGAMPIFEPFKDKHSLQPFMIAPTCIIAGIGESLAMDIVRVPGATGDHRSDFEAKIKTAISNLLVKEDVFGFVHIKAADDASHNGEWYEKVALLERVDKVLGQVMDITEEIVVVVTGDHTTPSGYHCDHTHHPVPFLLTIINSEFPADRVESFDELSVAKGCLGRFTGISVMQLIKSLH
jgi:2,3-diphosphopglycerate-independent phosphoglycerate mutase